MKKLNTDPIKTEKRKQDRIRRYEKKAYYSFATIILLIGIIIVSRSLYLNVKKYFTYSEQLSQLEEIHSEQTERNEKLKSEIKQFNTLEGIESIARNKLKMAEEDEVLVIIKNNKPADKKNKKTKQEKSSYLNGAE